MKNIYNVRALKKQNLFQKLFKIQPKCNVPIEIRNLLAVKNINDVKPSDINDICLKYKANIKSPKYRDAFYELYITYLEECLKNNVLTDSSIDELNHLKELLSLDEQEAVGLHNSLCGKIYKNAYWEQISDGNYSEEREAFIDKLQSDLKIPDTIARPIQDECRDVFIRDYISKIKADDKISPDEWSSLNEIAKKLYVTIDTDEVFDEIIERMKLNWTVEHGDLPVKQVDINLQKNENCYYYQKIDWLEIRKVTQRVDYGGLTYRFEIAKGLDYRVGSIHPQRITSDELQVIDTGTIYVTNKRLIFDGSLKNTNIPFGKILSITPYSDGVGIEKDSGRSPVFQVSNAADLLAMYISRLLKDFNG
jgi:hypothetical protein